MLRMYRYVQNTYVRICSFFNCMQHSVLGYGPIFLCAQTRMLFEQHHKKNWTGMYIRYSTPLYYAEIIQNHIKHLYKFSSNNFVYFWENNNACVQIPLYMRWMGGSVLVARRWSRWCVYSTTTVYSCISFKSLIQSMWDGR